MEKSHFHLLKTRRFFPLFLTQFLGAFNDNVFKNALVVLITFGIYSNADQHVQSKILFSAGLFVIPFILFSGIAGQLADKYERASLIRRIKVIEIGLVLLAAFGFYTRDLTILMTTLFLFGIRSAFFGPLKYAILPDHLVEKELIDGNAFIQASTFLAILTGSVLGGVIVLTEHGAALIFLILTIVALAGWISSCFILNAGPASPKLKINLNFLKEAWHITRHAKKRWDIYLIILGISWFWLVGGNTLILLSSFVKTILNANESVSTCFFALFSIGMALGSLLCMHLLKGKVYATYVPLGALGMAVFLFDLYFLDPKPSMTSLSLYNLTYFFHHLREWHILLDFMGISLSGGLYIVPLYALLQKRSQESHRARMMAANNIISSLFMLLGAIVSIILLNLGFSILSLFGLLALGNILVGIYVCKLLPDVLLKSFARWILKFLYRVEVKGLEHFYEAGERVMIIANHTSFLDGVLLASFLPEKITFAVNTHTVQQRWIRLFLSMIDAHPLDPMSPLQAKSLIAFIKKGNRCAIFPEGRVTVTGALMKVYEGPALIADKSNAKILPLCIEGAQYSFFSRMKGKHDIKWFPKITLTLYPPQQFELAEKRGRARRLKMGFMLYDLMTDMVFRSRNRDHTLFYSLLTAKNAHGRRHLIAEDIERKPITYHSFVMRCFILGKYLSKKTQFDEKVGILLPNSLAVAVLFFGLQAFSRVPAMLNYSSGINNVLLACQLAQIKRVYTSRKFIERGNFQLLAKAIENAGIIVIYLEDLRSKINIFRKLHGMFFSLCTRFYYQKIIHRNKKLDPNAPAVVLFTSGSEGVPKGVVLSHANLQANRLQLCAKIDFTPTDTVFSAMPVFHGFGLLGGLILPLLSGIRVFFYPSPLHYRIVPELIYDTNATLVFGTDTFLSNYAKYAHPYDFYSVRYVFAGAEKLKNETRMLWAEKFGTRLFEGYGVTEGSPVLAANTAMHNKPNTVGRLLSGIRYKLREIPGIKEGKELIVSGPNIMLGYLKMDYPGVIFAPEEGWYPTGDIVTVDEEGFIAIQGRVKRFAKIAGEMISLAAIENYLNQLWPGHNHGVVNLPDPKRGEQIVLVTNYMSAVREEIILFVRKLGIAEITIPKRIICTEVFPLLASGKIDYVCAKELATSMITEIEIIDEDEEIVEELLETV